MSLIEINWHPNRKELRNFAVISLIASSLLALLLYALKGFAIHWALVVFAIGFIIFVSSMISLKPTKIIYLGLMLMTMPIGLAVSYILLAAFYYLLLTPLGLFFRLMGRDPLHRRFDSTAKTYWITRQPPDNLDRYFHQF